MLTISELLVIFRKIKSVRQSIVVPSILVYTYQLNILPR